MKKSVTNPLARTAILTLAEIKAVIEAFDSGESNVMAAMDAILMAVDEHRAARGSSAQRVRPSEEAA